MIKLKPLLEQYELDAAEVLRIAKSMGETLGEQLGKGANGVAYATQSGRVLKITQDDYEIALATRLRTKRLYKHIVNVYDVRRITDSDYYVILMDRVTPLNRAEIATWTWIGQRFLDPRNTDEEFRTGQTIVLMPTQNRQGEPLDTQFVERCVTQRSGILRDFVELRIDASEAHAGNMGFNRHGNLVHFDAWQMEHYTQTQRRSPGEYADYKQLGYKLQPRVNKAAVERGFGQPISLGEITMHNIVPYATQFAWTEASIGYRVLTPCDGVTIQFEMESYMLPDDAPAFAFTIAMPDNNNDLTTTHADSSATGRLSYLRIMQTASEALIDFCAQHAPQVIDVTGWDSAKDKGYQKTKIYKNLLDSNAARFANVGYQILQSNRQLFLVRKSNADATGIQ